MTSVAVNHRCTADAVTAAAGERKRIHLEFYDTTGNQIIELRWIAPGQSEVAVPGANLSPRYGLVTSQTTQDDQAGPLTTTTQYGAPHSGLPNVETQDPTGLALATVTGYEAIGTAYRRRTSRTLPAGNAWSYSYYGATETLTLAACGLSSAPQAGALRQRSAPDPDGAGSQAALVEEYAYDTAGRLAGSRYGSESWSCTSYDARGRVTQQSCPAFGGEAARTVSYNYAVGGDPLSTSVSDTAGTIVATTDLLGRVVSYTDVWGNTTTTSYDQVGRATQASGPAGVQTFSYDSGSGRLSSQTLDGGTVASLSYDAYGELSSVSYPSGTGAAGNGTSLSSIGRDASGRTSSVSWAQSGGSLLASDAVVRSQSARVIDQTVDGNDIHSGDNFSYDAAGRLVDAWVPGRHTTYAFASSGGCGSLTAAGKNANRTSTTIDGGTPITSCYDNADRLTSTTDSRYGTIAYDAHGNTTTLGAEMMAYDAADRHIRTVNGSTTVEYVRDAIDRIVARKVNGSTIARYGYTSETDTADLTLDSAGQVVERVIGAPGGVLLTKRASAPDVWSYPNVHGDVIATANSIGAKQGVTVSYDPFGDALSSQPDNSAGDFDYGWLGRYRRGTERAAGMQTIEMGARPYVAGIGRFLEVDPVEGGSANDYDYSYQSPCNFLDLDGRIAFLAVVAAVGAAYTAYRIVKAGYNGYKCTRAITRMARYKRKLSRQFDARGIAKSGSYWFNRMKRWRSFKEGMRYCGTFAETVWDIIADRDPRPTR